MLLLQSHDGATFLLERLPERMISSAFPLKKSRELFLLPSLRNQSTALSQDSMLRIREAHYGDITFICENTASAHAIASTSSCNYVKLEKFHIIQFLHYSPTLHIFLHRFLLLYIVYNECLFHTIFRSIFDTT